jgi:putative flippase GtrA
MAGYGLTMLSRFRLLRYGLIGAVAAGVYFSVALLFSEVLVAPHPVAIGAAFIASGVVAYFGHYFVTFPIGRGHMFTAPRFLVQAAVAYLASVGLVAILQADLGWLRWQALAATVALVPAVNYLVYALWVFRPGRRQAIAARGSHSDERRRPWRSLIFRRRGV